MTIAAADHTSTSLADTLRDRVGARAFAWWPAVAALSLVVLARLISKQNVDISWVLTLGDRMLAGERLYIDMVELNPPAAVWLYVPAIVIGNATGLRAEWVVELLVLFEIATALWLMLRVLRASDLSDPTLAPWLIAAALLITGVLPARTFGEREHIGFVALLPLAALAAARAASAPLPPLLFRFAVGVLAGLAVVAKPHFAAAVALMALLLAVKRRSLLPAFGIEWVTAAAVAAAYAVAIRIAYPAFFSDIVPLVVAIYVPVRVAPVVYLVPGVLMLVAGIAIFRLGRGRVAFAMSPFLLALALGGIVSVLVQGKGWPYHTYPALAAVALVLLWETATRFIAAPDQRPSTSVATVAEAAPRTGALPKLAVVLAIALLPWVWFDVDENRDRAEMARLIAQANVPAHPTVFLVSADVSMAHPLVRDIGGRFAQTVGSSWIARGVLQELTRPRLSAEQRARLEAYGERDRAYLISDMRKHKPHVILFGKPAHAEGVDWLDWAKRDPAFATEMLGYRLSGTVDDVAIWHRAQR